jgi:hypothetical protein
MIVKVCGLAMPSVWVLIMKRVVRFFRKMDIIYERHGS